MRVEAQSVNVAFDRSLYSPFTVRVGFSLNEFWRIAVIHVAIWMLIYALAGVQLVAGQGGDFLWFQRYIVPVSYTHLDGYKR